ncbi:MAG: YiiX/YebB-like N1pC/P60 family cysteine hydrolase [Roseibacillus sp.]
MSEILAHEIESSRDTLLAVVPVMPKRTNLLQEIADAEAAQERGYYQPDEDERLREVFAQYLEVRTALRGVVARMEPWVDMGQKLNRNDQLRVFIVGFTAACFLVRSGLFMIGMAEGRKVVRRKLDEAEPRFNIPRKAFTEVYRLQSSVRRMWKFHEAWQFYDRHRSEIHDLHNDPELGEIVTLLAAEEPFMETRRREYWKHRLRYRLHSFRRRRRTTFEQTMFQLFEFGGRTVAELRDPTAGFRKLPKRAAGEPCEVASLILQPGDIIVTRHRDALSNLFLPGFWPHAALFVGELGNGQGEVVEAKKDGVRLRPLTETLSVDAFLVLRAKAGPSVRECAAERALTHVGKLYDFAFDFSQANRLACTALVYRSWHGQAGITFELGEQAGRMCLSAEDLLEQALKSGKFKIAAYYGPDCEKVSKNEVAQVKYLDLQRP